MATSGIRGAGVSLPLPATINPNALASVAYNAANSNYITLGAGKFYTIPSGNFLIQAGPYSFVQFLDPVINQWRNMNTDGSGLNLINSDGTNFRIANLSGCVISAAITTAGSGYTNGIFVNGVSTTTGLAGLTATTSAGGATWTCVVGGALSTTVTVNTGGTYTYAPNVIIAPPPQGGIQATAVCTLTSGAVSSVTIINQGAGYLVAPTITFIAQPYDSGTTAANATATLTGSGTLTGMYPNYYGTALTAVPTISFSASAGSGAAATAIMNFAVTGFTVAAGGVAYGNAQPFLLLGVGGLVTATTAYTNPQSQSSITLTRVAQIYGTSTAGGAIQTTGSYVVDSGSGYQAIPTLAVIPAGNSIPTTIAQATATVGGVNDTQIIQPV